MEKILLDPVSSRYLSVFKMAAKFQTVRLNISTTKSVTPLFYFIAFSSSYLTTSLKIFKEKTWLKLRKTHIKPKNFNLSSRENAFECSFVSRINEPKLAIERIITQLFPNIIINCDIWKLF